MEYFTPPDKLPDYRSVVGVLRNLLEGGGRGVPIDMAAREVSKQILSKWFHENVYHKSIDSIKKMAKNVYNVYTNGKYMQKQERL